MYLCLHSFKLMLGEMETITNKEVNVRLDNQKGTLCITGLLVGTMVFLYKDGKKVRVAKATGKVID